MNDDQLIRYSRHILLPEIDVEGQEKLLAARALIIGAGGLGSPAALYLAAAGVGTIVLADGDTVDMTNLQRQILHRADTVGQPKVLSGQKALASMNPECVVIPLQERLDQARLEEEAVTGRPAPLPAFSAVLPPERPAPTFPSSSFERSFSSCA